MQWAVVDAAGVTGSTRYSHAAVLVTPAGGSVATDPEMSVLMLGGFDAASNSSTTYAMLSCEDPTKCQWTVGAELQAASAAHPSTELLLLRHAAAQLWPGGPVVSVGGGAGCFSFGTHINASVIAVHVAPGGTAPHPALRWGMPEAAAVGSYGSRRQSSVLPPLASKGRPVTGAKRQRVRQVAGASLQTDVFMESVVGKRLPVVISGSYGSGSTGVVSQWDWDWMAKQGGTKADDLRVSVHALPAGAGRRLSFAPRNFQFETVGWTDLCRRMTADADDATGAGPAYYLRSVGSNPRKDVSHVREVMPALAATVGLPDWLAPVLPGYAAPDTSDERYFSSCVRVGSAGLELWTHYDMMDNVLFQLVGTKRVVLWPPTAADRMYMDRSTSTVADVGSLFPSQHLASPSPCRQRQPLSRCCAGAGGCTRPCPAPVVPGSGRGVRGRAPSGRRFVHPGALAAPRQVYHRSGVGQRVLAAHVAIAVRPHPAIPARPRPEPRAAPV